MAKGRPNSEAFLAWAEGMLAPDPLAGAERLTAAIETFRRLGRPIDEARCLMDRARLLTATGADGTGDEERARTIFTVTQTQKLPSI